MREKHRKEYDGANTGRVCVGERVRGSNRERLWGCEGETQGGIQSDGEGVREETTQGV